MCAPWRHCRKIYSPREFARAGIRTQYRWSRGIVAYPTGLRERYVSATCKMFKTTSTKILPCRGLNPPRMLTNCTTVPGDFHVPIPPPLCCDIIDFGEKSRFSHFLCKKEKRIFFLLTFVEMNANQPWEKKSTSISQFSSFSLTIRKYSQKLIYLIFLKNV